MKTKRKNRKSSIILTLIFLVINLMMVYFSSILAQVIITKPTLDFGFCSLPSNYFRFSDVVIQETNKADFSVGNGKSFSITAPVGFQFQPNTGSVLVQNGGNLSGATIVISAGQVTVQYTCNAISKFDVLTLTGLTIRAINGANSGNLVRTGGNAVINGLSINTTVSNTIVSTAVSAGTYRTKSNLIGLLDWNQSTTWECGVVPPTDGSANVVIRAYAGLFAITNCVFFSGSPDVRSIELETGSNFSPPASNSKVLKVRGDFTIRNGAFFRQRNWVQNGFNSIQIGGDFINNGEMLTEGANNAYDLTIEFNGIAPQFIYGSGIFRMMGNGNQKSLLLITNPIGVTLQANFSTNSNFGDPGEVVVNGYLLFGSELNQLTGLGSLVLNGRTTLKASTFNLHYVHSGLKTIANTSTIEFTNPNSVISSTNIPSLFLNNLQVTVGTNGGLNLLASLVVNGTLTMNSGVISTNLNNIQLGSSLSSLGTLAYSSGYINGILKRWFLGVNTGQSSGLFPLSDPSGLLKRFVLIEYTEPTLGGTLTSEWVDSPMGTNFSNSIVQTNCAGEFPISKTASGYWSVSPANGITVNETKKYEITLSAEGITDFSNDCYITSVKKSGALPWDQSGIHLDNLGNSVAPVIRRLQAFGWSNWGFAGEDSPLPIELTEFLCFRSENAIEIKWITSSEFNNDHFELYRSFDGINWMFLESVPAAGTSNENVVYQRTDPTIKFQPYYLLKQFDLDGTESVFGPIQLVEMKDDHFYIFPSSNPSHENFILYVQNTGLPTTANINILDGLGQLIYNAAFAVNTDQNALEIDLNNIKSGMYFIRLDMHSSFNKSIKHQILVNE
jgi:hypothetical protein